MILGIRSDSSVCVIKLQTNDSVVEFSDDFGRNLSNDLLSAIQTLLAENDLTLEDLKGIVVFRGPGSFTGLRISATVANTLSYALSVPIVGTTGEGWFKLGLGRLDKQENDTQVIPEYGADANITKPKK